MKMISFVNDNAGLEKHKDTRGEIIDIFYNASINHVAFVRSNKGSIRGNHYHKESTQHLLVLKGALDYYWKNDHQHAHIETAVGCLITTPPFEIHALKILEADTEFMVFVEGKRGGKDYELDTFRVPSIIE